MYFTGEIPSYFEENIIPIPKKKRAEKCEDCMKCITTHASNILTRIICRKIERRAEEFLAEGRFVCRKRKVQDKQF